MEEINSAINPVVKPKFSLKIPLLVVFVVLMMGLSSLATYLILKSPAPVQTPTPIVQTSPAVIVQPTPIPDPKANWKTYTDNKFNYEFKYPNDWFVKDLTNLNSNPSIQKTIYFNNEKIDYSNFKISMTVFSTPYDMHVRFLGYADAGINPRVESSESGILKGRRLTKTVRSISEFGQNMGKDYTVLISLGENTLDIYGKIENKNTIDQILSTFKFIQ